MEAFEYRRAATMAESVRLAGAPGSAFLAGGTELLNWMRIGIANPTQLIDIGRLQGMSEISATAAGGLRIGALAKLNDVALHPLVRRDYPVLSESILKAASAQIRNLATIGGNPLQRTRCDYFRAEENLPCNKRRPGSGCSAFAGVNDNAAIFGWTEQCVATQPSDPAVALAALDAVIVTTHRTGGRRLRASEFHTLPGSDPAAHNVLLPGELITEFQLPAPARLSAYLKVRNRESYEYATVSGAATLEVEGGIIRRARIALGSVAMRPWRLTQAEAGLPGLRVGSAQAKAAILSSFIGARALADNGYKITLAKNVALRVLQLALDKTP